MTTQPHHQRFRSIHDELPMDENGFLIDPELWTEGMACLITAMDGRGTLTPEHWSVLYFLREHYLSLGTLPPVSHLCRTLNLPKHRVKQLFGNCRAAWRTAGLPNPGAEALAYMA